MLATPEGGESAGPTANRFTGVVTIGRDLSTTFSIEKKKKKPPLEASSVKHLTDSRINVFISDHYNCKAFVLIIERKAREGKRDLKNFLRQGGGGGTTPASKTITRSETM